MTPAFLVIEPKKYQRRALCRLLRAVGAERVAEAPDVWSAKRLLGQRRDPGWVLLADPDLLGENGLDMLKPLASEHPDVRFLLLCARKPPALVGLTEQAKAHGIAVLDVLQKPVSAEEMGAILQHLIDDRARPNGLRVPAVSVDELGECLRTGKLLTRFQPKFDLATGRPAGCEALAYVRHTRHGELPATQLAQQIAQLGAQRVLTASLLRDGAKMVRVLRAKELAGRVSIALGAEVLSESSDAGSLDAYVRTLGVSPTDLAFEVVADRASWSYPIFTDNLARLRVRGYMLILNISPDPELLGDPASAHFAEIKLSWQESANTSDPQARTQRVNETIAVARKHGIHACASRLMSLADVDTVRKLGFSFGQGDVIARPMLAEEAGAWIEREERSPSFSGRTPQRHRAV